MMIETGKKLHEIWGALKKKQKPVHVQYVRSISPGCWGTCPTVTQGSECLSALWTSSTCSAWHRHPRWIVCSSEPFLGDQKWRNRRERGLDCMEGDQEPPTWISARVPWLCRLYETLHPWPSSGGQWTSTLLSEPLFVIHTMILSPVCTFQTLAHFFLSASGSFLF